MVFDRRSLSRSGSMTIVLVAAMHIYLAILLWLQPMTANATNMRALVMGFEVSSLPGGLPLIALVMAAVAAFAVAGSILRLGYVRVLMFTPLGMLLGFSASGGQIAAWLDHYLDGTGHYPDGTAIPWQHISADQVGYMVLFLIYAGAVLRRCWEPSDAG